jgi:periplasmic divalent cation tolerance protein
MTESFKIVLTTCANNSEANTLASLIITNKLAACVNILPEVRSVYMWEGKLEQQTESKLFIKTNVKRLDELLAYIKCQHSYDVPEIQVIDVSNGNPDYFNWINEVLS